jgi:FKBP-type peptidyl-prolyl cis-trans isomerase SlyD
MKVERDRVVLFHYELRDEAGGELDSSRGATPIAILHGHGNVLRGLEEALEGRAAGDRFEVTVPPEAGYGPRGEGQVSRVSKKHLRAPRRLAPGMEATLSTERGPRRVTVVKVGVKMVAVDLNHPLAGRVLRFSVEVLEVREAAREEIAHGHAHGPGGH